MRSHYDPSVLIQAKKLLREGKPLKDVAAEINVPMSTLSHWRANGFKNGRRTKKVVVKTVKTQGLRHQIANILALPVDDTTKLLVIDGLVR